VARAQPAAGFAMLGWDQPNPHARGLLSISLKTSPRPGARAGLVTTRPECFLFLMSSSKHTGLSRSIGTNHVDVLLRPCPRVPAFFDLQRAECRSFAARRGSARPPAPVRVSPDRRKPLIEHIFPEPGEFLAFVPRSGCDRSRAASPRRRPDHDTVLDLCLAGGAQRKRSNCRCRRSACTRPPKPLFRIEPSAVPSNHGRPRRLSARRGVPLSVLLNNRWSKSPGPSSDQDRQFK